MVAVGENLRLNDWNNAVLHRKGNEGTQEVKRRHDTAVLPLWLPLGLDKPTNSQVLKALGGALWFYLEFEK